MAESIVQVTEGTGKKLHTNSRVIGANTVEDEVVLLGENYLSTYVANGTSVASVSLATANSHVVQIMAGATFKVRIRRIEVYQIAVATAAAIVPFGLFRLTTAGTGGTVNGVTVLDPSDGAAGATCMTLPAVKGTEGATLWSGSAYVMQTVAASAQLNEPILVIDFDRPRSKPVIIAAGVANGVALKVQAAVAAATVQFNVWLDETSF